MARLAPVCELTWAVAGGINVPLVLGSRATFVLGNQGGHDGRALRKGDLLAIGVGSGMNIRQNKIPPNLRRKLTDPWVVRVIPGPQDHLLTLEPKRHTIGGNPWTTGSPQINWIQMQLCEEFVKLRTIGLLLRFSRNGSRMATHFYSH